MGLGIFCVDHLNCWLTAGSGAFCFSEGRICGEIGLGIRFLYVTNLRCTCFCSGFSASQLRHQFQISFNNSIKLCH